MPDLSDPDAHRNTASVAQRLDLFTSELPLRNKIERLAWGIVWVLFVRFSPRRAFRWRCFCLRCFGATVGNRVRIYPSVNIFLPRNLIIGDFAVIGPSADLYSVATIRIGNHAMVSQRAVLCTATHNFQIIHLPLVSRPIEICSGAWVCADAFIGPGVTVNDGAIVGARAVTFKNVESYTIVAGNPAKFVKRRVVENF
jgi:putative colanic acid biosynthesis acetyltransferase WcaF